MNNQRFLIITIDTEGDNCWSINDIKQTITTKNAQFLPRFQTLCEKYDFIPTYLVNHEMVNDSFFIEFGREGIERNKLEIGAHEHAWNQPPYYPLIKKIGKRGKPFLHEYPSRIIREKLNETKIDAPKTRKKFIQGEVIEKQVEDMSNGKEETIG